MRRKRNGGRWGGVLVKLLNSKERNKRFRTVWF
jgi:hypothetical protein